MTSVIHSSRERVKENGAPNVSVTELHFISHLQDIGSAQLSPIIWYGRPDYFEEKTAEVKSQTFGFWARSCYISRSSISTVMSG